ncbi:hypothetical protein [Sphingobacterium sp. IITKGP-BTPF85]|uniref:hypothetical protein n=1 Tax=Sphingobacterium sp. IITKGP-BTPF85 TaxID=1338009 RepID=UPI00038A465E|nr:hypothetical protein [Sphingobacterium sp. IITKGP-BTPF85]KKX51834.1 hypothetical protein L950_0203355 [Sphingobacterium sp. IITKGP-BTPF85]
MNNLDFKKIGLEEMNMDELTQVDGGKLPYAEYSWSGTESAFIYAAEAAANGIKLVYNGVAAAWNWATS